MSDDNSSSLISQPASSYPPSPLPSFLITINVAAQLPLKLTTTNFPSWRAQFQSLLKGYKLQQFIDDTQTKPAEFLLQDGVRVSNLDYELWERQDQLLLHAILASLTEPIIPLIASSQTAHQAWFKLVTLYANKSRSRAMQLKNTLSNLKREAMTVSTYMNKIKALSEELALIDCPVLNDDLIIYVLNGIGVEFRTIASAVRARDSPISFEELHDLLLDEETALSSQQQSAPALVPLAVANAARRQPAQRSWQPSAPRPRQHQFRPSFPPRRNQQQQRHPPYGDSRTATFPPSTLRVICQLCDLAGHTAKTCRRAQQSHSPAKSSNSVTFSGSSSSSAPWVFDSGATDHVTSDLSNFSFYSDYDGTDSLLIGDGSGLPISHTGSVAFHNSTSAFTLNDVLHVPLINKNLVSVSKFCQTNQVSIEFFPSHYLIKALSTGAPLLKGPCKDDLYELPAQLGSQHTALIGTRVPAPEWHHRLGHPSLKILQHILKTLSLPLSNLSSNFLCNACECNKSHKLPFSTSSIVTTKPLDVLFSDIWGPSPVESVDGYHFYVIFVDHFTKFIWWFPMRKKSDLYDIFSSFKSTVEKYFSTAIRTLYSDNGAEYIKLRQTLTQHGISHQTSPPHTPEHVGVAERRHRHIVETGLTLLTHASIPLTYWSFAFKTAVYLINRLPTPLLHLQSPFQTLFHESPNYHKLRVFGCLCYPWLRPYARHKLEPKSIPCVFLGYSSTQRAYVCLDPKTHRLFVSRHVQFDESQFPFSQLPPPLEKSISTDPSSWFFNPAVDATPLVSVLPSVQEPLSPSVSCDCVASDVSSSLHASDSPGEVPPLTLSSISSINPTPHTASPEPPMNTHVMTTRSKNNIFKPKTYLSTTKYPLPSIDEPSTLSQALHNDHWKAAMSAEFDALIRNRTWDLVPSSSDYNVLGCKWVYRTKRRSDGSIERYKARLVAKGFHQRFGVDYIDTFSPVIKTATIRVVLTLALSNGWTVNHFDVNNAFLHGSLSETVYMEQPPGFIDSTHPTFICKLNKAIYGLKQAPRSWYHALQTFLHDFGFRKTVSDDSLFVYHSGSTLAYFLVYVDDILLTGSDTSFLDKFVAQLSSRFSLKELGPLHFFLGMEVLSVDDGMFLSQTRYVRDLLERFQMTEANPMRTPMQARTALLLDDGSPLTDATRYRSLIGGLQYLTLTRPDIAFSVNKLAQFMHRPTENHWSALKRILRYLKYTVDSGLLLRRCSALSLCVYSDSDFAGNRDDFRSTSAFVVFLGDNAVSWKSTKQKTVSRSSTESEYRAIASATSELQWIQNLLHELRVVVPSCPIVYTDNLGAHYFSANPKFHGRMKHLSLDFHFVRERVNCGVLAVHHLPSEDQLADALTKALSPSRLSSLCSKIGVLDRNAILRGRVKE